MIGICHNQEAKVQAARKEGNLIPRKSQRETGKREVLQAAPANQVTPAKAIAPKTEKADQEKTNPNNMEDILPEDSPKSYHHAPNYSSQTLTPR